MRISDASRMLEKQRKLRFCHRIAQMILQNSTSFQWLRLQIRYAGDQWNFSKDQRIKTAGTIE
ncbi:MAG TPA: hypothetical protein VJX94_27585 [Stellaceae bacterium]|nr:hypothetical protein [Stellaceae bacterium]